MKTKITKKQITQSFDNVISVGYCDLQNLLRYFNERFYTTGIYGWNADVYIFDNTAIVTGYRPFGNIKASYNGICKKYNDKAKEIYNIHNYCEEVEVAEVLLKEFINEALNLTNN